MLKNKCHRHRQQGWEMHPSPGRIRRKNLVSGLQWRRLFFLMSCIFQPQSNKNQTIYPHNLLSIWPLNHEGITWKLIKTKICMILFIPQTTVLLHSCAWKNSRIKLSRWMFQTSNKDRGIWDLKAIKRWGFFNLSSATIWKTLRYYQPCQKNTGQKPAISWLWIGPFSNVVTW